MSLNPCKEKEPNKVREKKAPNQNVGQVSCILMFAKGSVITNKMSRHRSVVCDEPRSSEKRKKRTVKIQEEEKNCLKNKSKFRKLC